MTQTNGSETTAETELQSYRTESHFARRVCVTIGVMYDLKSHLRAHVTRLMLHYRDNFPYMESGATVMYGPLSLPKV